MHKTLEQYEKMYLYRRVVNAKLYIDRHFSESIDLDNISDQAHFSKYHFIRLFKSIYGFTPKNYLIKTRIDKAKEHLKNGLSVMETGFLVGLQSPTSFAGMFKKITGMSPSNYQKAQHTRKAEIHAKPLSFVPKCYAYMHGWTENSNFEDVKL